MVNHLTRMQAGYICIAGLELRRDVDDSLRLAEPLRHIRPVIRGRLSAGLLHGLGGPLTIGALVDLGDTVHVGHPPELEDYHFEPNQAHLVRQANPEAFWQGLQRVEKSNLPVIFGRALQLRERSMVVVVGQGSTSLGVLRAYRPRLSVNRQGKPRLYLENPSLSLSVTDLRLYEQHPEEWRLNRAVVDRVRRRLQRGAEVLLSVGLTRAWSKGDGEAFHWLQVNNIHLAEEPIW